MPSPYSDITVGGRLPFSKMTGTATREHFGYFTLSRTWKVLPCETSIQDVLMRIGVNTNFDVVYLVLGAIRFQRTYYRQNNSDKLISQ